jgi:hypothetical protein
MTAWYRRVVASGVLCLLGLQSTAQTADVDAMLPRPRESAIVSDRSTDLLVRFDRPINHELSWLSIVHDGEVIETMHPRLGAAPNVLFARIPTPSPGNYVVHWVVRPEGYSGDFPFMVGHVAASTSEGPRQGVAPRRL